MFGFKPPSEPPPPPPPPTATTSSNVPAVTPPTGLFQQSFPKTTTAAPVFGFFPQPPQPDVSAPTTSQPTGFVFQATTQASVFPRDSPSMNKPASLFKAPQFGFSTKPVSSNTFASKPLFSLPAAPPSENVQPSIFTQVVPKFSFTNESASSKSVPNKHVSFSFSNPDPQVDSGTKPALQQNVITDLFGKEKKNVFVSSGKGIFGGKVKSPSSGNKPVYEADMKSGNKRSQEGFRGETKSVQNEDKSLFVRKGSQKNDMSGGEGTKDVQPSSKALFSFMKAKAFSDQPKPVDEKKMEKTKSSEDGEKSKPSDVKSRLTLPSKKPPPLKVSTSKPSKSKPLPSPSVEEISKITAILCKAVPELYNNKLFMNRHFSRYGQVKSVKCNPKKEHTIVQFQDHESARAAKSEGTTLNKEGDSMTIFWAAVSPKTKDNRMSRDIAAELESMASTGYSEPRVLARPDAPHKSSTAIKVAPKKTPEVTSSSVESLQTVLEMTAKNFGDRYRILDARDKIMRMKLLKESDINKAKAVIGTCPDMCPEKERYSRREQKCLSNFEQATSADGDRDMNEKAMVKEYSRSSADQEEPLPHELRPPQTLQLTMDYLLYYIVNTEVTGGDWFDFIWNRTRAIRKDITQQHLCDPICVSLVEKCTRFHIHCAHAFSNEDRFVFDPKINNENLTKCLQTLKHFYHDLSEDGIDCPNEAEFMAYDILLNLNQGDIIRQAQQLRKEVRESASVRFATEVFFALNSNNYVRFFRLLERAGYLKACIMHRYFLQVRRKAMAAIFKAYRKPNTVEEFPLSDLIDMLCFKEDDTEVDEFCEWLQLPIIDEGGRPRVQLRRAPTPISTTPPITRVYCRYIYVDDDCESLAVAINGGRLPYPTLYQNYEPHSSFDSDGRLRREAYDALDQAHKVQTKTSTTPAGFGQKVTPVERPVSMEKPIIFGSQPLTVHHVFSPPFPVSPNITPFTSGATVKESPIVFAPSPPVIPQQMAPTSAPPLDQKALDEAKRQFISSLANQSAATILSDTVNHMTRDVCETVVIEVRQEMAVQEREERQDRICQESVDQLLEQFVTQEVQHVASETHSQAREVLLVNLANDLLTSVLLETLLDACSSIAKNVYWQEKEWAGRVQEFIHRKKMERVKKVFQRWQRICINRQTFQNLKEMFPSGPPFGFEAAKRIKLDKLSFLPIEAQALQEKKTSRLLLSDLYYHLVNQELSLQPVNIMEIVKPSLIKRAPSLSVGNFIFWKMAVVTLSTEREKSWDRLVSFKFKLNPDESYHTLQESFWTSHAQVQLSEGPASLKLAVSSQHLKGRPSKRVEGLKGLSALLVTLHLGNLQELQDLKERLSLLLSNKIKSVPFALLVMTDCPLTLQQEEQLLKALNIPFLITQGFFSRAKPFSILTNFSAVQLNQKFEECVRWLGEKTSDAPKLIASRLSEYLEDGLKTLVLEPVFQDLAYKKKCFNTTLQCPIAILHLYNSAVRFLANVVSSQHLQEVSWPAQEFTQRFQDYLSPLWNEPVSLEKVKMMVMWLQVEEPLADNHYLITGVESYYWVQALSRHLKPNVASMFFSKFEWEMSQLESGKISVIPWAQIMTALFSILLTDLKSTLGQDDIWVCHDPDEMAKFETPDTWFQATKESATESAMEYSLWYSEKRRASASRREVPAAVTGPPPRKRLSIGSEYYLPLAERQALQMNRSLEETLKQERSQSRDYTQRLRAMALQGAGHSPSHYFEPSLFDPSSSFHANRSHSKRSVRHSLPDNLEDSLYILEKSLKSEKESARTLQKRLKLLQDSL